MSADVANAWQKLNEADGVIPYLDYATPTFYDDISGGDPGAAGREAGPERLHASLEKDYTKFTGSL